MKTAWGVLFAAMAILAPAGRALPRPDPGLARTWWAYQPLSEAARQEGGKLAARSAIDTFVFRGGGGVAPVSVDRRTLLRRATFGLTGLPPTVESMDAFVADASSGAYERVLEQLLASPRYGEHWGRHWLDVVRYADTAGETADYPVPVAWRYRNYVIDSFNKDMPYDQFLREQLAGDILAKRGEGERYAERVTATGYLAISRRFGFDSENYHHLTIQDTIDTLGQSLLGLSLGCARCHDHPFDPVTMADYYALYGIFESSRYAFPGSEQKQRHRALSPLCPPEESRPTWRVYEARTALLSAQLEASGQGVPAATLRSLDDIDGDFEMQAPAAGGSNGVLVPPWVYEGPIAVTADAQSPFQNLHPRGKVGASVAAGSHGYRIVQALHPVRRRGTSAQVRVNLDFRVTADGNPGSHRFWLGSRDGTPALEILMSGAEIRKRGGGDPVWRAMPANEWQNLQLTLDLEANTVSGQIGRPGDITIIPVSPLSAGWNGRLECVGFDALDSGNVAHPAVAWDNLAIEEGEPLAPVTTVHPEVAKHFPAPGTPSLDDQIRDLACMDGDFETQEEGTPPAAPWGPGPNSVVRMSASSQSPFTHQFAPGKLGISLPNSAAYNGFGRTLPREWRVADAAKLFASFDFRCGDTSAGGEGTWRFYLGHGPGNSAAVELFINGSQLFRRSGESRDPVCSLAAGAWHHVQLSLDLATRSYLGSVQSEAGRAEFSGDFPAAWDGVIDYTFIDSYGHVGGVKPALDADNYVVGDTPLASFNGPPVSGAAGDAALRRSRVADLRRQQAFQAEAAARAKPELERLLIDGPFPLAYAMSEGTPRNARIQLRGEPTKPGPEVPRGFPALLGGGALPSTTEGSGRLELAEWLVGPAQALTARVMVNRIWQYHFGHGLVRTPNDFGVRGQRPDHPELLDFLASEFIRSGWSVKSLHRLIMTSAAYQTASVGMSPVAGEPPPPETEKSPTPAPPPSSSAIVAASTARAETADTTPSAEEAPEFQFARRRLGAEETRDAILLVSGTLDTRPHSGHPFPSPIQWGFTQHGPFSAVYDHQQRSVYLMTQRIKRHPFLALFDGADPNASTAERRTTTVPTQALYFLNDPFVHASSEAFADRLLALTNDETDQIRFAYRLALARSPTEDEARLAARFLAAYRRELDSAEPKASQRGALAALGRVLFGSNEFLTVD